MTCDRAIRLIEKLADGEATSGERADAETHLERCETCREHYQFVRALETASETIDWPEPPEAYWQHLPAKVSARLESEGESPRRGIFYWLGTPSVFRLGAIAATLTLAVTVGVSVLRDGELQPREEAAPTAAGKGDVADETSKSASPETPRSSPERAQPAAGASIVPAPQPPEPVEQLGQTEQLGQQSPGVPFEQETLPQQARELTESAEVPPLGDETAPATRAVERRARRGSVLSEDAVAGVVVESDASEADDEFQDAVVGSASGRRDNRVAQFAQNAQPAEPGTAGEPAPTRELEEVSAELASADAAPAASSARKESAARAVASAANPCARWHDYLAQNGNDGSESIEARYQVAVCSIDSYIAQPSADALETAERDTQAFLALEQESERADRLRERLEAIQ